MTSHMLPASASWYATRTCDVSPSGLLCYGGNNSLFIYEVSATGGPPKYRSHFAAHTSRVTSVVLCKNGDVPLSCSSGEDMKIRVHNLDTQKVLHEHVKHKGLPCVVDWSPVDRHLVASGDEKGGIIIWRVGQTDPQIVLHDNSKVSCLSFSPHDAALLAVGYKSGLVLVIDVTRGGQIVEKFRGHDEEIHGLCWAPQQGEKIPKQKHEKDEGDVDNSTSSSLSPPSKSPPPSSGSPSSSPPLGCLLATGSKDRTVRVWSTLTGRCLHNLRVPQSSWQRGGKGGAAASNIWVAVHWPVQSHLISSGFNGELLSWDLSKGGKNKSTLFSAGRLPRAHHRIVFTICSTKGLTETTAENSGKTGIKLITSSMDRQHVFWDLDSLSAETNLPSLGGFSYCLAQSPINPGRLAIGCGDTVLRVWSVDKPENPLEVLSLWQGIRSKVVSVAWHPEKEGCLAYGTEDGRVGIYNVLNNKPPAVSSTYHKKTVYVVSWGPAAGKGEESEHESGLSLYSLGDSIILQHLPQRLEDKATNINHLIVETNNMGAGRMPVRSDISWKPDMSVVAIGNDDGSVELFRPGDLLRLCVIQTHRKIINQIRWHPEYTAADPAGSPSKHRFWLATGSNDPEIHIIDTQPYIEQFTEKKALVDELSSSPLPPVVVVRCDRALSGHTHRITGLCWSPHQPATLVSASFDNTAQVWDVASGMSVANYRGHHGRLLTVAWSDLDPDLVYTGGQDNTVQAWKPSQQQYKAPPEASYHEHKFSSTKPKGRGRGGKGRVETKEVIKNGVAEAAAQKDYAEELEEFKQLIEERKKQMEREAEESLATEEMKKEGNRDSALEEKINTILGRSKMADAKPEAVAAVQADEGYNVKKDGRKRKKTVKALWVSSNTLDNRGKAFLIQDCMELVKYTNKEEEEEETVVPDSVCHMGHFVNRKSTLQLVSNEAKYHAEAGSHDQQLMLDMYKGDMAASLKAAAEKEQLTDWHLSLAASVSPALWRQLCLKYAAQLEKAGFYQKSATFYLAKNDVYGAIDMLKRNNQFKDAACIARLRLIGKDPAIQKVYEDWAEAAILEGAFEQAARCYLCLKRPLEAAKMLMRRPDLTALRAATYVALTSGDLEVTSAYATKFVTQCLLKWDWAAAADVISQHECFLVHGLSSSVHESIVRQLGGMGLLPEPLDDSTFYHPQDNANFSTDEVPVFLLAEEKGCRDLMSLSWPMSLIDGEALVLHVLKLWRCSWHVTFNLPTLHQMYRALLTQRGPHTLHNTPLRQVLVTSSVEVTLGILKLLVGETEEAFQHWALAIHTALTAQQHHTAIGIARLIMPQGPSFLSILEQQVHAVLISLDPQKAASRPSARRLSKSLDIPQPDLTDTSSVSTSSHEQDGEHLTPYGALRAHYAYCVLLHLQATKQKPKLKTETETESKEQSETKDKTGSETTGNVLQSVKVKSETETKTDSLMTQENGALKIESTETEGKEASSAKTNGVHEATTSEETSSVVAKLNGDAAATQEITDALEKASLSSYSSSSDGVEVSERTLRTLSQALLWDSQVDRFKYEDALRYIQQATSALILKHGSTAAKSIAAKRTASSVEDDTAETGTEEENAVSKGTEEENAVSTRRRSSGEYCNMDGGGDRPPRGKPHENIASSHSESISDDATTEEQFEEMSDEAASSSSQSIKASSVDDDATIVKAEDVVLEEKESADDKKNGGNKIERSSDHDTMQDIALSARIRHSERVEVEVHCRSEEEKHTKQPAPPLPELRVPLDQAFTQCSLPELTAHQQAIMAALKYLNPQDLPFPAMFESVPRLLAACSFLPLSTPATSPGSLHEQIIQWAAQNAYTTQQIEMVEREGGKIQSS